MMSIEWVENKDKLMLTTEIKGCKYTLLFSAVDDHWYPVDYPPFMSLQGHLFVDTQSVVKSVYGLLLPSQPTFHMRFSPPKKATKWP